MDNPFHYSKLIHQRTITPPAYSNYRRYKPSLRQEFHGQCVYCRALESYKGQESFGVDHYRPKKRFPALANEYLNLYYSCNRCNSYKGDFWPSSENIERGQFVPNPCEHVMFQHMRYKNGGVAGVSNAGKWTAEHLDLNDPQTVLFRESFVKAIEAVAIKIGISTDTIKQAKKLLAKAATPEAKSQIAGQIDAAEKILNSLESEMRGFLG